MQTNAIPSDLGRWRYDAGVRAFNEGQPVPPDADTRPQSWLEGYKAAEADYNLQVRYAS